MSAVAEKRLLRRKMEAIRRRNDGADAQAIRLARRFPILPPQIVAGYVRMGCELDPAPLLRRLRRDGCRILLPCVEEDGMTFRLWNERTSLIKGRFGVLCPPEDAPKMRPHTVLTPLLAFDRHGNRLGRGGGHYDRTIAKMQRSKDVHYVGLAMESQRVRRVPAQRHDVRLNGIETPARSWNAS